MTRPRLQLTELQQQGILLHLISALALLVANSLLAIDCISVGTPIRVTQVLLTVTGIFTLFTATSGRIGAAAILVAVLFAFVLPRIPGAAVLSAVLGLPGLFILFRGAGKCLGSLSLGTTLPLVVLAILSTHMQTDYRFRESLMTGDFSIDAFFHSGLAAMWREHGVISCGLDGLVPLAYHTLSHKIFAGISAISGLPALSVYAYVFPIAVPVLLVISLGALGRKFSSGLSLAKGVAGVALSIAGLRLFNLVYHAGFTDGFLRSESFCLALCLLCASIIAYLEFLEKRHIALLVLSCTLMIFAGLSKGTVGFVGFGVYAVVGVMKARFLWRHWLVIILAGIAFIVFVGESARTTGAAQMQFAPLAFAAETVKGDFALPLQFMVFLVFHYVCVWLAVFLGRRSEKEKGRYFVSDEFLVLVGLVLPGLAIVSIFAFAGGGGYFSMVVSVIALAVISRHVAKLLPKAGKAVYAALLIAVGMSGRSNINEKTALPAMKGKVKIDPELAMMVTQMETWRDTLPKNAWIKIENMQALDKIMGWKAYWMVVSLVERPAQDGVPPASIIPPGKHRSYGLADHPSPDEAGTAGLERVNLRFGAP